LKLELYFRRPEYLINRLGVLWWEKTHPRDPWMARDMVAILDDWIRPSDRGIEFGSGRSTVWLASRLQSLISIELDANWREKVAADIKKNRLEAKVDLRFFPIDVAWKNDIENSPYVRAVDDVSNVSIDFVLVDGWARGHCALVGIRKLKPGGVLVIDDIHAHCPLPSRRVLRGKLPPVLRREGQYHPPVFEKVMQELKGWRCIWTGNGKQDTALWQKP
jgi:hypothetical protein